MNEPTNNPLIAVPKGAASLLFEPCRTSRCPYGRGHGGVCVEITGNRPRRCRGCNEPVGESHFIACAYSEPNGIVESFDCVGDA